MSKIKILDCTLRDGGYINNWEFGKNTIQTIIGTLSDAGIDKIEYGFYSENSDFDDNYAIINNPQKLSNINNQSKITLMANFGQTTFSNIINTKIEIRLAFKPKDLINIEKVLSEFNKKNIPYSLNAMHIALYSQNELDKLINISNNNNPQCLTAVDTMGILTENDTNKIFEYIDSKLNKNTALGLHSHNNLDLSFKNTLQLLKLKLDRNIFIDSCIGGIARGGGILNTIEITEYLNKNYNNSYNADLLNDLHQKYIVPITKDSDFTDKYPYYLSAKYKCHPNYAKYLKQQNFSYDKMEQILSLIPNKERYNYSEKIIKHTITKKA